MTGQLNSHLPKAFSEPEGSVYVLLTFESLQTPMSCLFLHTQKALGIVLAYGSKSVKRKFILLGTF